MIEGREERDDLMRFNDIVQMSQSAAFAELMEMVEELVQEAHEGLIACLSMDGQVRLGLSMRYQQRLAFQRAINNWIESANKGQEEITERMRQELNELAHQRG